MGRIDVSDLLARLDGVRKSGSRWRARCPAHDGKDLNLSVWLGQDGIIQTKCFSHGCDRKEVIEAIGFSLADILPDRTFAEVQQHKAAKNFRTLQNELAHELLIILCWVNDSFACVFPVDKKNDPGRVRLAFDRAIRLLEHMERRI